MNYGDLEKQAFRTFLAFSGLLIALLLSTLWLTSNVYRVSNIVYNEDLKINMSSLESLKGTSIWLIDDTNFQSFYEDNPSVEKITIKKELPNTLLIQIYISEKLAYIQDNRQSPPKTFVLYKNLYTQDDVTNGGLLSLTIQNGPVRDGFLEEVVTMVMTLKKYPVNMSNFEVLFDGETIKIDHFNSIYYLGPPSDLARKAAVVGYYVSEEPCEGEVRLVYTEDGAEIRSIANCN